MKDVLGLLALVLLILLPLTLAMAPVKVLNWRWKYPLIVVTGSLCGLMLTSNAYHIGNSYAAFPDPAYSGFYIFGAIWSSVFCLPAVIVARVLSGREHREFGYDLAKGLLGSICTVVFIFIPSFVLIILLSFEWS